MSLFPLFYVRLKQTSLEGYKYGISKKENLAICLPPHILT